MRLPGIGGRRYAVGASVAVSIGSAWTVWCAGGFPAFASRIRIRVFALAPFIQRYEPYAGNPLVRICAGGSGRPLSLPRLLIFVLALHRFRRVPESLVRQPPHGFFRRASKRSRSPLGDHSSW